MSDGKEGSKQRKRNGLMRNGIMCYGISQVTGRKKCNEMKEEKWNNDDLPNGASVCEWSVQD